MQVHLLVRHCCKINHAFPAGEAVAAFFVRLHPLPILRAGLRHGNFDGFFFHDTGMERMRAQVQAVVKSLIGGRGAYVNQWMREEPVFHKKRTALRRVEMLVA